MRRVKCALILAAAVAALFVAVPPRPVRAPRRTRNSRLDYALHNPADTSVVAGHIASVGRFPHERWLHPRPFVFTAEHVLLGDAKLEGRDIDFPAATIDWPSTLVPLLKGARCILVLRDKGRDDRGRYWIYTVVPRHGEEFRRAGSLQALKRVLVGEILAELREEKSVNRQRKLIVQASPIMTPEAAKDLVPFLKSRDEWLRRAAIAGLCHATKRKEYLKLAMEDMKRYFRTPPLDGKASGPEEFVGYRPWWYPFFRHYYFLSDGWSKEEDASAPAYLPLFRQAVKEPHLGERGQWRHGIRPLCRAGTKEDLPVLHRYLFVDGSSDILENSYNRQALLRGMARILGLRLTSWVQRDFLKHEEEQREKVLQALTAAGIAERAPEATPAEPRRQPPSPGDPAAEDVR